MRKFFIFMIALEMILVIACVRKEEPKKDDFLAFPKIEAKKPETRIHVIDDGGNTPCAIIEVDGHQYLSRFHGGIVHLESCPCKKKL